MDTPRADLYQIGVKVIVVRKDNGANGVATILERIDDVVMVIPHWSGREGTMTLTPRMTGRLA